MIDLSFVSNVAELKAQLAALRDSVSSVGDAHTKANDKSSNSAANLAQKIKILKSEINDQKKIIREMEAAEKSLERQMAKTGQTSSKELKRLRGDLALARKELDNMNNGLSSMNEKAKQTGNSFKSLKNWAVGLLSVGAIVGSWKYITDLADEQALAEQKLLIALGRRKDLLAELKDQASELQKKTRFGDEATLEAQAQLAKFLGQNTEQIKILTPLVQDFATVYNMDLGAAAQLISKSIGSTTNMLSRYGIQIDSNIPKVERFTAIVDGLNKVVGGQAEAAAKVGLGSYKIFLNNLGDLFEEVGKKVTGSQLFSALSVVTSILTKKITPDEPPDVKMINQIKQAAEKAEKPLNVYAAALANVNEKMIGDLEKQRKEAIAKEDFNEANRLKDLIIAKQEFIRVSKELASLPVIKQEVDDDDQVEKTKKQQTAYEKLQARIEELNKKLYESVLLKRNDVTEISNEIQALEAQRKQVEMLVLSLKNIDWSIGEESESIEFWNKMEDGSAKYEKQLDNVKTSEEDFIELIKKRMDKMFDASLDSENFEPTPGDYLARALGFKSISDLTKGLGLIEDGFSDVFAAQKEQADAVVAIYDKRVSSAESALQTELDLQREGYASNVALKQQELAKLKEEREKAIQEQTEIAEKQQALETVIQAVNIATSISEIMKSSFKSAGIFGAILAPALIGGLFALWKSSISKVPSSLPKFAEGTLDTGAGFYMDSTGQRVAGVVHENETVTKKSLSRKYRKELQQIHNDIRPGYDPDKSKLLQSIDNSLKETITYEGGYKVIRRANRIKKIRL